MNRILNSVCNKMQLYRYLSSPNHSFTDVNSSLGKRKRLKFTVSLQALSIIFILSLAVSCTSRTHNHHNKADSSETELITDLGTGLIFDDAAYNKVPMKASLTRGLYSSVPSNYSLKEYSPFPSSQSHYGTCVGWASANARTILYAKNKKIKSKNEINKIRFSPLFIYRLIKDGDYNCQHGAYIEDAMELLKTIGAVKYEQLSHLCVDKVPHSLISEANKFKIKDYVRLFNYDETNLFKIEVTKKSISEGNPVVIGMKCPQSFHKARGVWQPGEDYQLEWSGHAMCVIGYDDNKYGGAFLIMNSWGSDWGNNGYIWIQYETYADFTRNAFELVNNINIDPEPTFADLSGKLEFILSNNQIMPVSYQTNTFSPILSGVYKVNSAYSSGTMFRLYISNNEPAFVYALSSDNTLNINKIFPHINGISPILNYKNNQIAIPDEEHYIQMDNVAGTDIFCLLYSKEALNIDEIIKKLERTSGTFSERLRYVLSAKLVDAENIEYDKTNISFSAFSKGKTIVPVIVKIKHIK